LSADNEAMMFPDFGYRTAAYVLDRFWMAYRPDFEDDLPALLGAMALNVDGQPMDPAMRTDWAAAVGAAGGGGLEALVRFLEDWRARGEGEGKDISRLLTWIQDFPHSAAQLWDEAEAAIGSPSLQME
jgi:hypothetical protein